MLSVTDKIETRRTAVASSILAAGPSTLERVKANDLPKKDVLAVARTAGILAAKKTSEIIPFCHPIPLDYVGVEFELKEGCVVITATVEAVWKTGVEMEALTAAGVAALTLYDMLKPIDAGMKIKELGLVKKKGGRSDFKEFIPEGFKAAVVVTSDGTHQGTRQDKSGKIILERLKGFGICASYFILPDDQREVAKKLKALCDEGVDLVVTTGGTGLGPRDVTVEATRDIMEREVPGMMEAARSYGQRRTPYAMLSRGLAAQRGKTLILNLPGSSNGTREALNSIFPAVFHAYPMMEGGGHGI